MLKYVLYSVIALVVLAGAVGGFQGLYSNYKIYEKADTGKNEW